MLTDRLAGIRTHVGLKRDTHSSLVALIRHRSMNRAGMVNGHLSGTKDQIYRLGFVHVSNGLPACQDIVLSKGIVMRANTVFMAAGNGFDTTQLRVTRRQRQPGRNKGMRLNAHIGRILMPTHKTCAFRFLEKQHGAIQHDVLTYQIGHRSNNHRVMRDLIDAGVGKMRIVAIGRPKFFRVRRLCSLHPKL